MAAPNLNDPAARQAYRAELRGIGRSYRFTGLGLAVVALILSLFQSSVPDMPRWLPMVLIVPAGGLLIMASVMRTRHHLRRMRGE